MKDAELVRGVKNEWSDERVLKHGNLVTRTSICIVRRTRGLRTSTTDENLVCMPRRF